MFLRSIGVVLLAGVLALPGTVQAGHGGGGHGGGGHGGYGHGGYGHGGYGYGGYGYGGFYPGYYGYGGGGYYPYLSTPYYYPAPAYSGIYSVPAYTDDEATPPVVTNTPFPEESNGIGAVNYTSANAALVEVRVPPNADVWFEGDKTQQKGEDRLFTSPQLEAGRKYSYDVKVHWMDNGKPVERQRTVSVEAGKRTVVDFRKP